MRSAGPARFREVVVAATLLSVSVLQSLPPLLNAAGTQSDAAIVGLEAMHALRGELSWFLWGSGYQTSVDAWVAAGFFRAMGVTPLALMLSAFTGYLLLIAFAYATLRRHFEAWSAALLVTPLVIMAPPVHIYAFYPPRQAALTLVFAAVFILDGAQAARAPKWQVGAGAFVAGLACFADPYALLFLPFVALFVTLLARGEGLDSSTLGRPDRDRRRGQRLGHGLAGVSGLGAGLLPFFMLSQSQGASHGVFRLTTSLFFRNVALLTKECLPFVLATGVRRFTPGHGVATWVPPAWFHAIQVFGACSLVAGILVGGIAALAGKVDGGIRRLGAAGALMLPVTLSAFAVSAMVMDRLSARYLVAFVLTAPFALAPVLRLIGPSRLALMLAPYLVSASVGGFLGYGDNVDGARIRLENGRARDEIALSNALRARHVHYGLADYWVAYRLTFLFRENPILVPWHAQLDRYPPYRRAADAEPVLAYVYDPLWSVEDLAYRKAALSSGKLGFEPNVGSFRVGRYTVLILRRTEPGGVRVAGTHAL